MTQIGTNSIMVDIFFSVILLLSKLEIVNEKMASFLTWLNNKRRNDIFVEQRGGGQKSGQVLMYFVEKRHFK